MLVNTLPLATRLWHTYLTWTWTSILPGWATKTKSTHAGGTNGAHKYLMFRYPTAGTDFNYGWLELSTAFDLGKYPTATLYGYAIESHDEIIAGQTIGDTSAPEPSTAVLTALGALALGAEGMRRWRKARKQAAA